MCEEKLYHDIYFDEMIHERDKKEDEPIALKELPFFGEAENVQKGYARNTAVWDY